MRQYQLQSNGDKYIPVLVDVLTTDLKPDEIRLAMDAWSLNYRDLLVSAINPSLSREGIVPVSDGSGVIIEVGKNVTHLSVGQRVCPIFFHDWRIGNFKEQYIQSALGGSKPGVLSEEVVIHKDSVVVIPKTMPAIDAATLPCAAVTAWQALFVRGYLNENSTLLIQGTGGVALFALQFAKAVKAKVILISSSNEKLKQAKDIGADVLINYNEIPDWDEEVRKATNGVGVTHVLELGGPQTFAKSLNCLSAGGYILQIGVLTGFGAETNLMRLQSINATICGISVGSHKQFEDMLIFLQKYGISPIVSKVYPFEKADEAFDYLSRSQHMGKVCLVKDKS